MHVLSYLLYLGQFNLKKILIDFSWWPIQYIHLRAKCYKRQSSIVIAYFCLIIGGRFEILKIKCFSKYFTVLFSHSSNTGLWASLFRHAHSVQLTNYLLDSLLCCLLASLLQIRRYVYDHCPAGRPSLNGSEGYQSHFLPTWCSYSHGSTLG